MVLLQITEPNEPNSSYLSVGIDLGTTNSLIASVKDNEVAIVINDDNSCLFPSKVKYFGDGTHSVGNEKDTKKNVINSTVVSSVKRLVGKGLSDIKTENFPFKIFEKSYNNTKDILIETCSKNVSPVKVSGDILKFLVEKAEIFFDQQIKDAVITVPAYFDDSQRQATKDAAKLAGINVLRLLNEPTAAALAYGLDSRDKGYYLVFDLGGGTFDVSVLSLTKGVFEVLATGGDPELGGDDFDNLIAKFWTKQKEIDFKTISKNDLKPLLELAKECKESFSSISTPNNSFSGNWSRLGEKKIKFLLTKNEFKKITSPLVSKAMSACKKTLFDSKITKKQIDKVILVGGATRMTVIQESVENFFECKPLFNINPDEVVAIGAALQADLLAGNREDEWLLLDVIPLSLGLETMGGLTEKIIERNSTIPITKSKEFTTFKDGQTSMSIHILQGERELVSDCRSLAQFQITSIPPMVAGAARIEVMFSVNADGLLSVTATEKNSGVSTSIEVKPSYGLTDDEITKMLEDGFQYAKEDKLDRSLREGIIELDRTIYAIEQALAEDKQLLSSHDLSKLEDGILNIKNLKKSANFTIDDIDESQKKLDQLSEPLVSERMNNAISSIIVGKSIDEIDNLDSKDNNKS